MAAKKAARPKHVPPKRAKEEKAGKKQPGGKPQFDNKNRGALFLNDKDGNEARPDYTGVADIEIPEDASAGDVVKFRIAGWKRTSTASGKKFISINVQKADQQGNGGSRKPEADEEDD